MWLDPRFVPEERAKHQWRGIYYVGQWLRVKADDSELTDSHGESLGHLYLGIVSQEGCQYHRFDTEADDIVCVDNDP